MSFDTPRCIKQYASQILSRYENSEKLDDFAMKLKSIALILLSVIIAGYVMVRTCFLWITACF